MSVAALRARIQNRATPLWVAAALVCGSLAGLAVGTGPLSESARLLMVGAVGITLVAAVMWKAELGVPLMLVALSFDVGGRIISDPMPFTAYQVVLLLTLGSWGVRLIGGDREVLPRFTLIDVGVFFLLFAALWSLPASLDRGDTTFAVVRLGFIYLFYLVSTTMMRQKWVVDAALAALVVSGCFQGVLALAQARIAGFDIGNTAVRLGGPNSVVRGSAFFDDPNYLAAMLAAAILVALIKIVHSKRWSLAAMWLAAAGVCTLGMYATFSRTGLVGVAIGLPIVWLTAPAGRRKWVFYVGILGVAAILAVSPDLLLDRFSAVTDVNSDNSAATRYYMVISTFEIIRDYWATGTGLGAFDMAYPAYRIAGSSFSVIRPHQLPLAMWAEMGVAGLIAELLLTFATVRLVWTSRFGGLTLDQKVGIALVSSFAVQSLFQYFLYFEYVWFALALLAAACVSKGRSQSEVSHV